MIIDTKGKMGAPLLVEVGHVFLLSKRHFINQLENLLPFKFFISHNIVHYHLLYLIVKTNPNFKDLVIFKNPQAPKNNNSP